MSSGMDLPASGRMPAEDRMRTRKRYADRLGASAPDKLRVLDLVPEEARDLLDVGCCDGQFTRLAASRRPNTRFKGIDLDEGFVRAANVALVAGWERGEGKNSMEFERVYLRELLAREQRYDAVTFVSVLHEFFSYGEGISSVLKALADAHELLRPGGVIVIRDMVLREYAGRSTFKVNEISAKIEAALETDDEQHVRWQTFTQKGEDYGYPAALEQINHYLLKSLYPENWHREILEDYTAVSFEQYERIFSLLGMRVEYEEGYLLPYLRDTWRERFGLSDAELHPLLSTGLIMARKTSADASKD